LVRSIKTYSHNRTSSLDLQLFSFENNELRESVSSELCSSLNGYPRLTQNICYCVVSRTRPVKVLGLEGVTVVDITAGTYHNCVRSMDGHLYCWGSNSGGQLGDGSTGEQTWYS